MMSSKHVVISTKHPVAGYLYLEMIPDSEVGFSDIYQITDSLFRADVLPCDCESISGSGVRTFWAMAHGMCTTSNSM